MRSCNSFRKAQRPRRGISIFMDGYGNVLTLHAMAAFTAAETRFFARNACARLRGDPTDPVFDAIVNELADRGIGLFDDEGGA